MAINTLDVRNYSLVTVVGLLLGTIVAWVTWSDGPVSAGERAPSIDSVVPVVPQVGSATTETNRKNPTLSFEQAIPFPVAEMDPEASRFDNGRYVQRLSENRSLVYTLVPAVQKRAQSLLDEYKVDYGAVVAIEPQTGRILGRVSSSTVEPDIVGLTERAHPPAASVFKVITTASLLESIGLEPSHVTCFHGGRRGIWNKHLRDDPKRDHQCQTLTEALGRSSNVIYGKLATRHLDVDLLSQYAHAFGWDRAIQSIPSVEPSRTDFDRNRLEFARGAAGFYHTKMSPMHGAMVAATIANEGVMMSPQLVERYEAAGQTFYQHKPQVLWRTIQASTAKTLAKMMVHTTEKGTSASYFRKRRAALRNIDVAAKTGSLSNRADDGERHHYSWWVGFAPAENPRIALAAMVVSIGDWRIKSSHVAREVLQAYFSAHPNPEVGVDSQSVIERSE